jgi:glutathione S-transferase
MTLTLHLYPTINAQKVTIALAEMELDYEMVFVDILSTEHPTPEFLALNPNGRMPVLTDSEAGVTVFESAAILQYLGRKTGKLYPADEATRTQVESWLYWQMAGQGPMMGQLGWFERAAANPGRDPVETSLALHRFGKEVSRLFDVMERGLAGRDYLCGEYTIADICAFTWLNKYPERGGGIANRPALSAWRERLLARPAVQAGLAAGQHFITPKE